MAAPLLTLQDIHLTFGGAPLLEGANLSVGSGERLCLVGRNGSGKSTLLRVAAGIVAPDRGTRFLQPGATVRYLPQEPDFAGFASTLAYVEAGAAPGDDPHRPRALLEALGLTGGEDPARLSGGEARRAALARALAPEPDILLLDEPTNHLDLPAIAWLEETLGASRAALVLISHDRRFLNALARRTVWLAQGGTRDFEGRFAAFEDFRDTALAEAQEASHKLARKIAREEDWLRHGVTARRKRNQGRLRALRDLRKARREAPPAAQFGALKAADAGRSGALVSEARGISKSFGGTPIVKDFSLRLARGERLGIAGPNGAGKTTLIKLVTGQLAPDAGEVRLGTNLAVQWLDQRRDTLGAQTTLADALTEGRGDYVMVGGQARHVVGYMKDFLFAPEQARTPLSLLSGGERGRLMLARAFAKPSNLLVLDEPTNDLDLETLDLLEELIAGYAGTVLLVSHDRDFLDRTVTAVLAPDGAQPGTWTEYPGGYSDMIAARAAARPAPAAPPAAKAPRPSAGAPGAPKRKLSFKEKHAFETLPGEIEALERTIERLKTALADPALYAQDRAAFARTGAALHAAQQRREALEEEWLALALLKAELEE